MNRKRSARLQAVVSVFAFVTLAGCVQNPMHLDHGGSDDAGDRGNWTGSGGDREPHVDGSAHRGELGGSPDVDDASQPSRREGGGIRTPTKDEGGTAGYSLGGGGTVGTPLHSGTGGSGGKNPNDGWRGHTGGGALDGGRSGSDQGTGGGAGVNVDAHLADGGPEASSQSRAAYMPPFILGADISRVQEHEMGGTEFKDVDGTSPSGTTSTGGGLLTILKRHGFNYIRLRTFVDPAARGGYSSRGFCDTEHTVQFAKGVKAAQMGLLLDLHYSDTWADPGAQKKPAAWAGLSFAELKSKVYDYTKDVLVQLVKEGARPDIVQIGNEIPSGLLWEDGRASGSDFANLGALLKAGISAVRDVDANIKIMMHLNQCHQLSTNTWWLEGVWGQGVDFDILGESCYDRANYQQPASSWASTFSGLIKNGAGNNKYASKYAKLQFIAVEYSDSKRMVNETLYGIADNRGLGTFIWEPTNWGEMMFDRTGKAIAEHLTLFDEMARTYGSR